MWDFDELLIEFLPLINSTFDLIGIFSSFIFFFKTIVLENYGGSCVATS